MRDPGRIGRLKLAGVDSRRVEQWLPVRPIHLARPFLPLGRDDLQLKQPPLGVEPQVGHTGHGGRWIGGRHDPGREEVVVEVGHHDAHDLGA